MSVSHLLKCLSRDVRRLTFWDVFEYTIFQMQELGRSWIGYNTSAPSPHRHSYIQILSLPHPSSGTPARLLMSKFKKMLKFNSGGRSCRFCSTTRVLFWVCTVTYNEYGIWTSLVLLIPVSRVVFYRTPWVKSSKIRRDPGCRREVHSNSAVWKHSSFTQTVPCCHQRMRPEREYCFTCDRPVEIVLSCFLIFKIKETKDYVTSPRVWHVTSYRHSTLFHFLLSSGKRR